MDIISGPHVDVLYLQDANAGNWTRAELWAVFVNSVPQLPPTAARKCNWTMRQSWLTIATASRPWKWNENQFLLSSNFKLNQINFASLNVYHSQLPLTPHASSRPRLPTCHCPELLPLLLSLLCYVFFLWAAVAVASQVVTRPIATPASASAASAANWTNCLVRTVTSHIITLKHPAGILRWQFQFADQRRLQQVFWHSGDLASYLIGITD